MKLKKNASHFIGLYAGVEHAFYKPIGLAVADSEIEKVNLETWNILWDLIRWGITQDIKMVLAKDSYKIN